MPSYQHIKYATKQYKHIKYEVENKIARVILNRPEQRNVQSTILLEEVDHAIAQAVSTSAQTGSRTGRQFGIAHT